MQHAGVEGSSRGKVVKGDGRTGGTSRSGGDVWSEQRLYSASIRRGHERLATYEVCYVRVCVGAWGRVGGVFGESSSALGGSVGVVVVSSAELEGRLGGDVLAEGQSELAEENSRSGGWWRWASNGLCEERARAWGWAWMGALTIGVGASRVTVGQTAGTSWALVWALVGALLVVVCVAVEGSLVEGAVVAVMLVVEASC